MSSLHYDSNDRDDGTFKRCPFCGGEADLRIYDPPFVPHTMRYYVACSNCGAMTHPWNLKERAIALWNRRQDKEDTT